MRALRVGMQWALAFLLTLGIARGSLAEETVYYAGFAYLGDAEHIAQNYPYTHAVNSLSGGQPRLDRALYKAIAGEHFPSFILKTGELANRNSGSATALAFALDREVVSVERIGNDYKLLVELSAQALFFDYVEMSIVGVYPVSVQYIDVLATRPSRRYIKDLVRGLYLGGYEVNVFDELIQTLKRAKIKTSYNARLRISHVSISNEALAYLPDLYKDDPRNLEMSIADHFGAYLTKYQGVPLLPFSKGYAIGNKMALTVANGDVYNLEIPEADFEISLSLEGFKKVMYQQKAAGKSWVYGAYVRVKVTEPLSGEVYLNAKFKNGALKIVPSSQDETDDWPAFQEAMLGLFSKLTKELSDPTPSWTQKYSPSDGALEGMRQFKEVIERCV